MAALQRGDWNVRGDTGKKAMASSSGGFDSVVGAEVREEGESREKAEVSPHTQQGSLHLHPGSSPQIRCWLPTPEEFSSGPQCLGS